MNLWATADMLMAVLPMTDAFTLHFNELSLFTWASIKHLFRRSTFPALNFSVFRMYCSGSKKLPAAANPDSWMHVSAKVSFTLPLETVKQASRAQSISD